jgi:hypothetical protein
MKSGKYGQEWYDGSSREFLVENPFMRKTKVKQGKMNNVQTYVMKSKAV